MDQLNTCAKDALALLIACEAKSKELHVQTKADRQMLSKMGIEWALAASKNLGMDSQEFIGMCLIVSGRYHGFVDDGCIGPPAVKWTE